MLRPPPGQIGLYGRVVADEHDCADARGHVRHPGLDRGGPVHGWLRRQVVAVCRRFVRGTVAPERVFVEGQLLPSDRVLEEEVGGHRPAAALVDHRQSRLRGLSGKKELARSRGNFHQLLQETVAKVRFLPAAPPSDSTTAESCCVFLIWSEFTLRKAKYGHES